MPFSRHFAELKVRLIVSLAGTALASVAAFIFYEQILDILTKPFMILAKNTDDKIMYVHSIYEGFHIKIKVSILCGFILSLPLHLYNLLAYVFPGLEKKHKRVILVSLLCSSIMVFIGLYYGYYQVIPISVQFLTSSNFILKNIGQMFNYEKNIFFVIQFILASLILFQLPLLVELLLIFNVLKRKFLYKITRHIILGILLLSALLTPPDIASQLAFALPLIILFLLALLVAKIFKFGEE